MNLHRELSADLRRERYDHTPEGVYFPRHGIVARGEYFDRVNDGPWVRTPNLVVDEGLAFLLNVALGAAPKATGFYMALFSGPATPQANWTAAAFPAAAAEIVSLTEGYTGATRPQWNPAAASGNSIDNLAAAATVTFATASSVMATGTALLTSAARGGTTGALISAARYAAARTFQNGDTFSMSYRISLTD